jgi:hypothetical protein
LAKIGDGAMVGMGVGADVATRDRIVGRLRELAAGEHAGGVAVKDQRHQHRRVVGPRAGAGVGRYQPAQIEPIDDLHHEPRQMIFGQVLLHRRREHIRRLPIHRYEVHRHAAYSRRCEPGPIVPEGRADKSDRLLGHESIETTQTYMHAHLELKEAALAKLVPHELGEPIRFQATDQLLAFLDSL